jgi:glycine/D-amino acid oxidase-like deaminating enzyme
MKNIPHTCRKLGWHENTRPRRRHHRHQHRLASAERGHEVIVVDRQPDAALETSFANAAQISVSYCEPWANKHAPAKLLKWMFRNDAPLLFRPQLDWQQWRWGLQFLASATTPPSSATCSSWWRWAPTATPR